MCRLASLLPAQSLQLLVQTERAMHVADPGWLALQERICEVRKALLRANLPFGGKASQPMSLDEYCFKHEPADYNVYWDVRKGLIPIVGAARETGAPGHSSGV